MKENMDILRVIYNSEYFKGFKFYRLKIFVFVYLYISRRGNNIYKSNLNSV
jgi:hypothetical protein